MDAGGRFIRQDAQREGRPKGSTRLLARGASALGRDREHRSARNAALGKISPESAGDPQGEHRSAACAAGIGRFLQRGVRLSHTRRARRRASDSDRASARAARAWARRSRGEIPEGTGTAQQNDQNDGVRTGWVRKMAGQRIPINIKPEQAAREAAGLAEKIARGAELFSKLRE